jgi:LmbE family N-acetylglucosaminyl deacetylase
MGAGNVPGWFGNLLNRLDIGIPMLDLVFPGKRQNALEVLCIGAHCDDIEIGCAATLMRLADERPVNVSWVTLTSTPKRAAEGKKSAKLVLRRARRSNVQISSFRDGFLPAQWAEVKGYFETLKSLPRPDVIFTHDRDDLHQDHRIASELTWNTFRDHLILEFEIPKFDGGLMPPNLYVPVNRMIVNRKCSQLQRAYVSQRDKAWFNDEAFRGVMRLRGLECNAPDGYAEAFHARKVRM